MDAGSGRAPVDPELLALGWDDRVADRWAAAGQPGLTVGRVIRTSRRFTYVGTASGLEQAIAPIDLDPAPVAGDWVGVGLGDGDGSEHVAVVLPRWSELTRRDPAGTSGSQVLAADVDLVLIVAGLDRPVKPGRIERSLVLAWDSGATPTIVLTKADAVSADELARVAEAVADVASDVEVVLTSTVDGTGLDRLHELLDGRRSAVLLGESGAGKSTLLNRLADAEVQRTAEVRSADAKGRHTTVSRDLVVLPTGGIIIDTPGLRGLGLLDADEGLASTFPDIEQLATACRFRDCGHGPEPGCAVRDAVAGGSLDATRLDRYLGMQVELDEGEAQRVDAARRRSDRSDANRRQHDHRPDRR